MVPRQRGRGAQPVSRGRKPRKARSRWTLLVIRPAWSYRLNASFEDHAEHEYMSFVASHPELGTCDYDREALAGYGQYQSVADLLRQVGHDERVHKLESLDALRRPRIR